MAITPPTGYITRPKAPKIYNRSMRALERKVENALAVRDQKILRHWKLVTKDHTARDGNEVTTSVVNDLVANGETPTWCVEESYLQEKYGRRDVETPPAEYDRPSSDVIDATAAEKPAVETRPPKYAPTPSSPSLFPDDIEFLKERIRTLEREKQSEVERNEKREAKLFEQLAVKDKQISAWDEITQGITRGLATGQLTPMLPGRLHAAEDDRSEKTATTQERQETTVAQPATATKPKRKSRKSRPTKSPKKKARPPQKKAATQSPSVFQKHTPTFRQALTWLRRK